MKSVLTMVLGVFVFFAGYSQKETTQTIDASEINILQIESDEVFKITITTAETNSITIKTESEGEYFQNISLITELTRNTLKLTSKYPEILTSGYDKLSAHKVFAVQVYIEIPKNLEVSINSNVASVFGFGEYDSLQIQLKSGQCVLKDFSGNLLVNTYNGNILVETAYANVQAKSRNGTIENYLKYSGEDKLDLKTIDGNIIVRPSH